MEIKQGDKVRVSKSAPNMYFRGWDTIFKSNDCNVLDVEDDNAVIAHGPYTKAIPTKYLVKVDAEAKEEKFKVGDRVRNIKSNLCGIALSIEHGIVEVGIPYDKEKRYWNTDIVELIEPTEQTEAEKNDADNLAEWANEVSKAIKEYGDAMCQTYIDAHTEAYWDAYTADLAKEVVLKTVNSASDRHPMAIAEYATDIAKAVVEGLKRKWYGRQRYRQVVRKSRNTNLRPEWRNEATRQGCGV